VRPGEAAAVRGLGHVDLAEAGEGAQGGGGGAPGDVGESRDRLTAYSRLRHLPCMPKRGGQKGRAGLSWFSQALAKARGRILARELSRASRSCMHACTFLEKGIN